MDVNPNLDEILLKSLNLGSACETDFKGFLTVANEARLIVQVARQVECDRLFLHPP
jgi:hypothetical protein